MNFLIELIDRVPTSIFEVLGTCAGSFACIVLLIQIISEIQTKRRSSLSVPFLFGWLLIFLLWFLYGVRFRTVALWATNLVGVGLQTVLIFVTFSKRRKYND